MSSSSRPIRMVFRPPTEAGDGGGGNEEEEEDVVVDVDDEVYDDDDDDFVDSGASGAGGGKKKRSNGKAKAKPKPKRQGKGKRKAATTAATTTTTTTTTSSSRQKNPRKGSDSGANGSGVGGGDDSWEWGEDAILDEDDVEVEEVDDEVEAPSGLKLAAFDFSSLPLKSDHVKRPIWVCPDGHIFLETFSPLYTQAYEFLIAISEPVCRPELLHEYQLSPYSLYAAVSVGLDSNDIISVMERLSKNKLPQTIKNFVLACTSSYGKVKLVLQRNRYYVESSIPDVLKKLLLNKTISDARVHMDSTGHDDFLSTALPETRHIAGVGAPSRLIDTMNEVVGGSDGESTSLPEPPSLQQRLEEEEEDSERIDSAAAPLHSFEIDANQVEDVKRECIGMDFPMLEEYDFRNDSVNKDLDIDLKPTTSIRPYQEKSLSKMFGNGRARSGIIVLPCGAGKTLVGITACCTVKKSTLVLCTSSVAVEQWRNQFKLWSTIDDVNISRFTSDLKESPSSAQAAVVISTYAMVAYNGKRSVASEAIMRQLGSREWGMLILDEVHVVPAAMFRRVLTVIAAHCKMGLTATLVREDERIKDLNFLIGPKLYEANWIDLARSGHIANVQCAEVWCQMAPAFYREYLECDDASLKKLLFVMNPNKMMTCEFLIRYHEQRGDKILVFADNVYALQAYAKKFGMPFIHGPTKPYERMKILTKFKHDPSVKTIFISKVGDNSIDLPEANVIIQISSHYGSRRQEAQRLGRILRPKSSNSTRTQGGYNAFFYSLVSRDTQEMFYSSKRQQFLVNQGYSFKVVTHLPDMENSDLFCRTEEEQTKLLTQVINATSEDDDLLANQESLARKKRTMPRGRRIVRKSGSLSGGVGSTYYEYTNAPRHSMFRKRYKKR
eukprot:TRINITY_DN3207_c3_g1_i1.p1 TRINITY_DN3207_c3_g1~~TRINITY_DN3207_c3_g1_i1.p1  ORF type:complete len:893 (-),score=226.50 TRINITY_DN3207_c3_g1_i1:123-2801(-)